MPSLTQSWIETGAVLIAVLLIPLYMGYIHVSALGAAAYAAVGGVAMAIGEQIQFGKPRPVLAVSDVVLWGAAIAGSGGIVYGLALLLI